MQPLFTSRKLSKKPHNRVTTFCVIPESTISCTITPFNAYGVSFAITYGANKVKRKVVNYKKRITLGFFLHEHKFVEIDGMFCVKIVTDVEKPKREAQYKILFDRTKVETETTLENVFVDESGNATSRYVGMKKRKRDDEDENEPDILMTNVRNSFREPQTKPNRIFMGDDVELVVAEDVEEIEDERDALIRKHPHNQDEPNNTIYKTLESTYKLENIDIEYVPNDSIITQVGKPTIFMDDEGYTIYYKFDMCNSKWVGFKSCNIIETKMQFGFSIGIGSDTHTVFVEVDLPKIFNDRTFETSCATYDRKNHMVSVYFSNL